MHTRSLIVAIGVIGLLAGCATAPATVPSEPPPIITSPPPPVAPHRPIGTLDMMNLQRVLARKGYYHGKIDGKNGPLTKAAVMKYQQEIGVAQTGDIDEQTLDSLGLS